MVAGVVTVSGAGGDRPPPSSKPRTTGFVWLLAITAAAGGFLFGYDTGVVSAANIYMPKELDLSYGEVQAVVSITTAFCALFSLVAGWTSDRFGRKPTIMGASLLFTVGSIELACSWNFVTLLIGRAIVGAAIGLASMTVPPYISEACPTHVRGPMVVSFQLMITFGIFCSSVLGASYNTPSEEFAAATAWRLMFATAAVPAIVQFVVFFKLPESPRWLVGRGEDEAAEKVVKRMYADEDQEWRDYELAEMAEQHKLLQLELEEQRVRSGGKDSWTITMMLRTPHVRRALALGCTIQMFQQLGGINTLMYYTATIIKMSGITGESASANDAIWYSCMVSGTNFLFTFVPIFVVERMGRRALLLLSDAGIFLSLLFLGGAFLVINLTSADVYHRRAADLEALRNQSSHYPVEDIEHCLYKSNCDECVTWEDCGFCYEKSATADDSYGWCLPVNLNDTSRTAVGNCSEPGLMKDYDYKYTYDYCESSKVTWLVILAMLIYLVMFSVGFGPMAWVINAEIYPTWARSTGVALATATNWIFNFVISETFLSVTEALMKFGAFFLYAGITLVGLVIFYFALPETKGLEMERIEDLFKTKSELEATKRRRTTYRLSINSMPSHQQPTKRLNSDGTEEVELGKF